MTKESLLSEEDPCTQCCGSGSGFAIYIQIQEGNNDPQK